MKDIESIVIFFFIFVDLVLVLLLIVFSKLVFKFFYVLSNMKYL